MQQLDPCKYILESSIYRVNSFFGCLSTNKDFLSSNIRFQAVIYINIRVKEENMSRATLLQEMDLQPAEANNQDTSYVEMGNTNYPKETTAAVLV